MKISNQKTDIAVVITVTKQTTQAKKQPLKDTRNSESPKEGALLNFP